MLRVHRTALLWTAVVAVFGASPTTAIPIQKDDILAVVFGGPLQAYDASGTLQAEFDSPLTSTSFSPTVTADGTIWVSTAAGLVSIDPATGTETLRSSLQGFLAAAPDGTLVVSGADGVSRFDPVSATTTLLIPSSASFQPEDLTVEPSGIVWITDPAIDGVGGIFRYDPVTNALTTPTSLNDTAQFVTVSPDGDLIVALVFTGLFRVDTTTFDVEQILTNAQFETFEYPTALSDGRIAFSSGFPGQLVLFDPVAGIANSIVSLPNGRFLDLATAVLEIPEGLEIPILDPRGVAALVLALACMAVAILRRI